MLVKSILSGTKLMEWKPLEKRMHESHVQPWPLVFLLNSFSSKHIFIDKRIPLDRTMTHHTVQFIAKQKWRWWHRNNPRHALPSLKRFNVTPPCDKTIDGGVENWIKGAASAVSDALKVARRHWKWRVRSYTNISEWIKMGLDALETFNLCAVKRDKEPGFVVLAKSAFQDLLQHTIMDSEQYLEASKARAAWPVQKRLLENEVKKIVKADKQFQESRGNTERDGLRRILVKPLSDKRTKIIGHIDVRCKTHKEADSIGARILHATTFWISSGVAAWVSEMCREYVMRRCPWCVADAGAFKRSCVGVRCDPQSKWIKADVKDFFYSGSDQQILEAVRDVIPASDKRREAFISAIAYLLDNQLISIDGDPRIWFSMKGSAMGLLHSGDLMDLCFYSVAERFISRNFQTYGIKKYWRYKDDLLFLVHGHGKILALCRDLNRHADWFSIKYERIGTECEFLEFKCSLVAGTVLLHFKIKENAQRIPIAPTSGHPKTVHLSWPEGRRRRVLELCNGPSNRNEVMSELRRRFASASHPASELFKHMGIQSRRKPNTKEGLVWMVLPYHPAIERFVQRAVHLFNLAWAANTRRLFGQRTQVKVAWTTGASNLLQALNRRRKGMVGGQRVCVF